MFYHLKKKINFTDKIKYFMFLINLYKGKKKHGYKEIKPPRSKFLWTIVSIWP